VLGAQDRERARQALPASLQGKAEQDLHAIHGAANRKAAERATLDRFVAKYDKAAACLAKDRESLRAFHAFPAEEHWTHIRTSNPIENTFATVRLRAEKAKGRLPRRTAPAMAFKLAKSAGRHRRRLHGRERLAQATGACASATASPSKRPKTKPPPDAKHQDRPLLCGRCQRVGTSSEIC
jgi:putative transposase